MATRSHTTFKKRQKEQARLEKRQDKLARRQQRKLDGPEVEPELDPITGLPIEPLIDPETGLPIEKDDGDERDDRDDRDGPGDIGDADRKIKEPVPPSNTPVILPPADKSSLNS